MTWVPNDCLYFCFRPFDFVASWTRAPPATSADVSPTKDIRTVNTSQRRLLCSGGLGRASEALVHTFWIRCEALSLCNQCRNPSTPSATTQRRGPGTTHIRPLRWIGHQIRTLPRLTCATSRCSTTIRGLRKPTHTEQTLYSSSHRCSLYILQLKAHKHDIVS